jgi:hypothetical protein
MMKSLHPLATVLAVLLFAVPALGGVTTTLPLNTGYDHSVHAPYPAVTSTTSTVQDRYWINIASYPTTPVPVGPSFVIPQGGWAPPMPGSRWITAWNTLFSPNGTSTPRPAYTIFRKCFCLSEGYKNALLRFDLRADDTVQAWLNTQLNPVLPAPYHFFGNFLSTPLHGETDRGFRVGRNCLYVLVEDTGGAMGFDLAGDVSADGLLPTAAYGVEQTFGQCSCGGQ